VHKHQSAAAAAVTFSTSHRLGFYFGLSTRDLLLFLAATKKLGAIP